MRIHAVIPAAFVVLAIAGCGAAGITVPGNPQLPDSSGTTSSAASPSVSQETVTVTATPTPTPTVTVTAPPPVTTTVLPPFTPQAPVQPTVTVVSTFSYPGRPFPVTLQPPGLYCRDLKALGYPWGDALFYWNYWGQPDNMDIDLNGIPCETVYP